MREAPPYRRNAAVKWALIQAELRNPRSKRKRRNGLDFGELPEVSTNRRMANPLPEDQHEIYKYLELRI